MRRATVKPGRRWLILGMVALLAIVLPACSLDQFKTSAARVPQMVVAGADPKTFNYILSQEVPNVFSRIYSGLLREDGVTGELSPGLAESWEVSPDQLRVVFTLRQGLKWSDGQPLTVDDVLFTFQDLIFNEAIPTPKRDGLRIGEQGQLPQIRKLDDRRVEFSTPEPFAPLLRMLAGGVDSGVAILPKHVLSQYVYAKDSNGRSKFFSVWGTETDPRAIVCSGPYRLVSYTPNQRVIFERNPYYWRKDSQGTPLPYIDRFIWEIVDSGETSLSQFRSNGLDALSVGPSSFSLLKREEERGNFTIYNYGPAAGMTFISFNLNQGRRNGKPLIDPIKSRWFNSLAFRQAVAYGIDRRRMINNLYRGLGEPLDSTISVSNPYNLSRKSGRLKTYDYDPEKAKALLLGAGFRYNAQGQLLDADNKRVRFTLLTTAGGSAGSLDSQIKQDLSAIGIQVDLQTVTFNTLLDKLDSTLDWECVLMSFSDPDFDPNGGANVWQLNGRLHMFNQAPPPGEPPLEGRVISDWEAAMARLFTEGARTLDETQRKEIYAQTQIIAQEHLPFINLINPLSMIAVRNTIQGVKPSTLKGPFWNLDELKLVEPAS